MKDAAQAATKARKGRKKKAAAPSRRKAVAQTGRRHAPAPPRPADRPKLAPDSRLEETLRTWRLAEAKRRGVPAFRIFSDQVLKAVAAKRPATARNCSPSLASESAPSRSTARRSTACCTVSRAASATAPNQAATVRSVLEPRVHYKLWRAMPYVYALVVVSVVSITILAGYLLLALFGPDPAVSNRPHRPALRSPATLPHPGSAL